MILFILVLIELIILFIFGFGLKLVVVLFVTVLTTFFSVWVWVLGGSVLTIFFVILVAFDDSLIEGVWLYLVFSITTFEGV